MSEQPKPTPTSGAPIWELVVADMKERDRIGRERYGTPLQAHNGRDALQDAYEEALDLAVYLRQAIEERRLSRMTLREKVKELRKAGGDGWDNIDDPRGFLAGD